MRFYLGTHRPNWLGRAAVPLFLSHRTLKGRKTLPRAAAPWALDSGGFTELSTYGEWRTSADDYHEAAVRYTTEIGMLDFAAPRDWMCEPWIIAKTGLSVREHQRRTITDYLDLSSRGQVDYIPVLQGWDESDYLDHIVQYADAGVDLTALPVVGIGSVCRRQGTEQIGRILANVASYGIQLHGFGIKKGGLTRAAPYLTSADSMAWSLDARWSDPIPGHPHKSCSNCQEYAMRWRDEIVAQLGGNTWSRSPSTSRRSWQPTLLSPTTALPLSASA